MESGLYQTSSNRLIVPETDRRVHENLNRLMDRRLSNVQQQLRRESDAVSRKSQESRNSYSEMSQRHSIVHQPKIGSSVENGTGERGFGYAVYPPGLAQQKRRRTSLWEALTGLVCSLGALASRAAKMAARRSEPL